MSFGKRTKVWKEKSFSRPKVVTHKLKANILTKFKDLCVSEYWYSF